MSIKIAERFKMMALALVGRPVRHPITAASLPVLSSSTVSVEEGGRFVRVSLPEDVRFVLQVGRTEIELTDAGAKITAPRIDLN